MSEEKILNYTPVSDPADNVLPDEMSELEAAEQVEEILNYYKDIPYTESDEDENSDIVDETVDGGILSKLKHRLSVRRRSGVKAAYSKDEEIHESSYGIPDKAKPIITYCITGAVCVLIIGGAFFAAYISPKDDDALNIAADGLRQADDYKTIKEEFDNLSAEVDALRTDVETKKEDIEKIADYENTRAELREAIKNKQAELDELNTANAQKQAEIDSLNTGITEKSGGVKELSPGKYTVGSEIAPGKYSVVGTGKMVVSSSDSVNKFNKVLTSTPVEITLETGDKITLEASVKFTFIN